MCETWVASLLDENFENARDFMPERWLGGGKTCPFLSVPFGVGKRMCPGKRVAELEILITTAKVFFFSFHFYFARMSIIIG